MLVIIRNAVFGLLMHMQTLEPKIFFLTRISKTRAKV